MLIRECNAKMDVKETVSKYRIVPVVVFNSLDEVRPKLRAMCGGGLPIAEITFRTACAADAIKIACDEFPEMLIGAGTVINTKQAEAAFDAGAKFIVSPGFSKKIADFCAAHGLPYFGGCVTPTEIMTALSHGCSVIKFFPCVNYGGIKTMKALSAAFPAVTFLPTGGINEENLAEYLAWDKIVAVGGSWMMKGTPDEIKEKCRLAIAASKK